jgi:cobyrinic acid a,c-diamide synthase
LIAAPHSGSGKTMLTMGLLRALRNRGKKVSACKVGPDYIDPRFHEAASGSPCLNLDLWAMGEACCRALLARQGEGKDLVIVEGVMGLFDGPQGARGSTADLAEALGLPIVLVIDATHQAQSVAALAHGFASYRPSLNIAGVILNRVRSPRHAEILQSALTDSGIALLGAVSQNAAIHTPSRHLGLVQAQELQQLEQTIEDIASSVARETFLDKLSEIGREIANQREIPASLAPLGQHIAVARDEAFSFSYPHVLAGWREQGAEISFFSPRADDAPSQASAAVFLPGGYPELHAGKLAANSNFLNGLRSHQGPVYGECGGYMVLGEALIDQAGTAHQMAGLLPVTTSFAERHLHLGYRELAPLGGPWSGTLRGHEFHYSTLKHQGGAQALFHAKNAAGEDLGLLGCRVGNVFGSYAHIIAATA